MAISKQNIELLGSAARIATPVAKTMPNVDMVNMHLIIDVTAIAATPIVTPAIEALDPISGSYYPLLATPTTVTATGTFVYRVGESEPIVAGLSNQSMIPRNLRFSFAHTDADSITYSASLNFEVNRRI